VFKYNKESCKRGPKVKNETILANLSKNGWRYSKAIKIKHFYNEKVLGAKLADF